MNVRHKFFQRKDSEVVVEAAGLPGGGAIKRIIYRDAGCGKNEGGVVILEIIWMK
jgi:hypothetical protein